MNTAKKSSERKQPTMSNFLLSACVPIIAIVLPTLALLPNEVSFEQTTKLEFRKYR